ncbi:MAG TPA: hypothetical protein DCY13_15695, partial [Verrucomicrobiales bacterium]|nr:hypothetical protein [Verrucomicrobiales bacterium]
MPGPRKKSGSEPSFDLATLRAMMERTLGGTKPNRPADQARAQDLVYDAMEASTWERRLRLAHVLQADGKVVGVIGIVRIH